MRAIGLGLAAGVLGGTLALGYAWLLHEGEISSPGGLPRDAIRERLGLYAVLAIVAAPLAEELIFRALLYRGMRPSLGPVPSALFSALVFALVHPLVAFVPVLTFALLAAACFERSRLLLARIVAHATYNGIVLLGALHLGS